MSKWSSAFRDSRWQKKRLEIMERDKWTCRSCGKSGENVTLNVHHAYYEAGKAPWEYPSECLITYCEDCHIKRHELQNLIMLNMTGTTLATLKGLEAMSASYHESLQMLYNNSSIEDKDLSAVLEIIDKSFCHGWNSHKQVSGDPQ